MPVLMPRGCPRLSLAPLTEQPPAGADRRAPALGPSGSVGGGDCSAASWGGGHSFLHALSLKWGETNLRQVMLAWGAARLLQGSLRRWRRWPAPRAWPGPPRTWRRRHARP